MSTLLALGNVFFIPLFVQHHHLFISSLLLSFQLESPEISGIPRGMSYSCSQTLKLASNDSTKMEVKINGVQVRKLMGYIVLINVCVCVYVLGIITYMHYNIYSFLSLLPLFICYLVCVC